jgi:hypothetical protein
MITRKALALTAAGVVLVGAAGVAAAGELGDDPESSVAAIEVGRLSEPAAPAGAGGTSTTTATRGVSGLTELSGRVTQAPDDDGFDDLVVEGIELDFGPDEWTSTVGPTQDFDGDGTAEALADEFRGLRDTDGTFMVRIDDDGDEADVYLINGLTYHDPAGEAPWVSGPAAPTGRDAQMGDDDATDDNGGDRDDAVSDDGPGDDSGGDRDDSGDDSPGDDDGTDDQGSGDD